jgi:hypothetical protein
MECETRRRDPAEDAAAPRPYRAAWRLGDVTVRVTAGVERVLEPEASASTSSSHPASQTLRLDPRQRPQNADELSGRLLACSAARAWSPVQARAWWEAHRELVQHRVRERTASVQGSFDARPREKPGRLARRDITARERW